ncbi:hypothetical protein GYH30_034492 [Glycine max]|nr:hypothetical protein GYH30_034492 [Glycine max]
MILYVNILLYDMEVTTFTVTMHRVDVVMFENKKFGTMGKGGDIHNDNICNDDVCDNSEAECEDWRK